ncbi:MAG TPA: phospholipid carrier-dependent glycosyltransferase [Steroidobacteraceae bacterium]|nr:phospholipid carrier-dependent glycosyltransferase [Steroidobacteraceae bacterium]
MSLQLEPSSRARWLYVGLAALVGVVWLATLDGRPLFNPDEGRYAEIPREMASGGDWVIPHLNGLDYIEKPPLQYWATAATYRLLGVSEFSARLYTALTALAAIVLIGFLAGRLWDSTTGWRAAAVLSGMFMFVVLGQLMTLDMSLTFWMTASLVGFLLAQQAKTGQPAKTNERGWMLIAWAAAALGVLTKGLVAAAIPAAVLVIYSLWARDFTPWRKLHAAWGLPLFLIIAAPWHWLAARRLDDFLQFFFVHEHFARYLTPIADRQEAWWFFGYVFLVGTVPWTVPALRVLASGWRARAPRGEFSPTLFLWIWVVFICVFFSLSDSKLMPYILPAMPALAPLIAALPSQTLKKDFLITAILTTAAALALGAATVAIVKLLPDSDRRPYFLLLAKPLREAAALLLVSGAYVWVQGARDVTRAGLVLGVGWCLAVLLLIRSASVLAPIYSGIDLAAALPAADRAAPLYSVRSYDQSLTFYLQRTVMLVGYRGELEYGLRRAPDREITQDEFPAVWNSQPKAYAVMDKRTFNTLKEHGVPMRTVGQNVDHVMVARQ